MVKRNVRYALALAIFVYDDKTVVAGKRVSAGEKEYPGFWSVPSQRITQEEYQMIQAGYPMNAVIERLCSRKLAHLSIENIRLLKSGERQRERYDLKMLLVGCESVGSLPTKTEYYDAFQPMSIFSILESNAFKCGTCVSLLHQYFVDTQKVDPGIDFLEIPPSMASSDAALLDKYTPEQLWKLAAGNYRLLLSGRLGGDGNEIRSVTLDRALSKRFDRLISTDVKFLDVGCGDGKIVEQLRKRALHAYGLELQFDQSVQHFSNEENREYIIEGNIYSLKNHFFDVFFDVVLLNLVVQWLPDINFAIDQLKSIIAPGGKLIVTMTTPSATYCGGWKYENNSYVWEQTKRVPERKLVMINRMVGPLWFFGRSIITLLNEFQAKGFTFHCGEEVFLDSYLSKSELNTFLVRWPAFRRSLILPPFVVLEFQNNE